MVRLPIPGQDDNTWGTILNDFLTVEHNSDGSLKASGTLAAKADDSTTVHNTTNETIAGTKTFSSSPVVPIPTTGSQATNKTYVDSTVSAGAPDASTTTKGLVQLTGDLSGTATTPTLATSANVTSIISANTTVAGAAQKASNLSDLASAPTARTNLGLGTAATHATGDFDAAGAATTVATNAANASNLTSGTVADARLPVTAQAGTLSSTYASVLYGGALGGSDGSGLYPPQTKPQPWVAASDLISQFESGHGWTGSTGFVANDTTDYITGAQSSKVTTSGTGAFKIESPTLALDFTSKQVRCRVKIDDITNVNYMNVWVADDSGYANAYKWFVQGTAGGSNAIISGGTVAQQGWVVIVLNVADAQIIGSPTRTGITKIKFEIARTASAGEVTLHVDEVDFVPEPTSLFPNGAVVICFDDVLGESWAHGKPVLDLYRYRASTFVITDQVGQSGRVTADQLRVMQDEGHEINSHAFTDSDHAASYTGMTAAALDADLRAQKAWLRANGFRGDGTAYPLGQYGSTTDGVPTQTIVQKYFPWARTTAGGTNKPGGTYPIGDPFRIPALSSVTTYSGGFTPAALIGSGVGSLQAVAANHGVKILTFHKVVTGAPGAMTEIALSDFQSIIAEINSLGMAVLTFGEFMTIAASASTSISYGVAAPTPDTKVGAVGAATTVSRSDHTHGRYNATPPDRGWFGWTNDPETAASSTALATSGTVYVFGVHIPDACNITNLVTQITTLGGTLTSGQCFAGIYQGGTLLGATVDQSAVWASPGTTGVKSMAISGGPVAVAAGEIQVAFLFNGTTGPTFPRGNGNAFINTGFASPKYATADTGRTTLPSTLGALTALSVAYCVGVS